MIKFEFNSNEIFNRLDELKEETYKICKKEYIPKIKNVTPVDKLDRIGKGELMDSIDGEIEDGKLLITASSEHYEKYGKQNGYYKGKGETDTNYAYIQHENETYNHLAGKTHHYITNTLYRNENILQDAIVEAWNKTFGR